MPEFAQQILLALMPAFYVGLFGFFIAGVRTGFVLSDFSLFAAITLFLLGKLTPVLMPGLSGVLLSGCIFALTIGILIGYSPRWFITQIVTRIS